jgi:hypothetical protein
MVRTSAILGLGLMVSTLAYSGTAPDTMNCRGENERCLVPVYVESDGATGCVVRMQFGQINVFPPKTTSGGKIKIVWLLQLANSDDRRAEFQFEQADGVKANAGQDPDNEFRNKTPDGDEPDRRFRWTSFHPGRKGKDVDYTITVLRTVGKTVSTCRVDPKITNQN